jgi:putative transposase
VRLNEWNGYVRDGRAENAINIYADKTQEKDYCENLPIRYQALSLQSLLSLTLKYSPSTALTASGMDSSFRAFRSWSRAFTISSDMATIILFIAKFDTLPMYSDSNLYSFWLCIAMCSDRNMATVVITREERGRMIAEKPNQIQRLDDKFYKVNSQSRKIMYDVCRSDKFAMRWVCSCLDWQFRQVKCKHIWACEISSKLREVVRPVTIAPLDIHACLYCHAERIVRDGCRHNKYGDIQIWNCKVCGRYFTINVGFEHMKHNPQGVTTAMQLYFSGESLRNVAKSLQLIGVQVSHKTVYLWIKKYTALMEKYLDKIAPQVSDTWRADELYLKVRGNMKYLYALMDDETRFWIAKEVSDTKYHADVHELFKQGRKITGKAPTTIITDGAPNFHAGIEAEFWREKKALALEHVQDIRMDGTIHNNKMERMNGEIRDREKVVRGVKKDDSPLIEGYQLFHNYIRPHMALDGKTPADVAGIEVKGDNKWLTIIQHAARIDEQTKRK